MKRYIFTVFAIDTDFMTRFTETYEAEDVPGAFAQFKKATEGRDMLVAAVVLGDISPVDQGTNARDYY